MELTGKIIKVLPIQSGTGKNGIWKEQEYKSSLLSANNLKS